MKLFGYRKWISLIWTCKHEQISFQQYITQIPLPDQTGLLGEAQGCGPWGCGIVIYYPINKVV